MKKILLVEDEDIIRRGLALTFDWHAHQCSIVGEASNGQEALDMIEKVQPNILITDIKMPEMNGLELLDKCRQYPEIVTIILSSFNEFEYAKQAIKMGAIDYLLKPLDHNELSESLRKAVHTLDQAHRAVTKPGSSDQQQEQPRPEFLSVPTQRIIAYIEAHYTKKVTVQDIADHIEKSPTYVHNLFKKEMNQTINQYINKLRIQKSIFHMQNGNDHIYSIALEVGYSDYKYFTTVFKKHTGKTPSGFIRELN
ncbi:response regulator [Jeotgalibacillus sp. JSM ZJ347]|uniref:response regulator transcription factor n=1 Tax=Jeotgalibacillus sp. JSM ZJ347 TaxID=3342117 RepID=UPI0035A9346B